MSTHAGGFTCAEVDEGSQHMAASISHLREERAAAVRAYDAEVLGRREEVTRLHGELAALRAELGAVVLACDSIPDVTISKWACDPGGHWNRVREALRARRAAQGLDVDAADPETAFDDHGWLRQRRCSPAPAACRRCFECLGQAHHWLTSMPDASLMATGGDPFIPCKHCDARAGVCSECCEGAVWPATGDKCELCLAPGGV